MEQRQRNSERAAEAALVPGIVSAASGQGGERLHNLVEWIDALKTEEQRALERLASGAPPTAEELTRMLGAFSGSGDSALPRLFKVPMPPAQKPTLAFYRNGFTVTAGCSEPSCTHDDSAGPCPEHVPQTTTFRSLATAETARFLREICEGTRPRELRGVGGFWVRDERHADLPEDAFQAFSGSGQKLGNVQGALPPAAPPMMAGVAAAAAAAAVAVAAAATTEATKAAEAPAPAPALPRPGTTRQQSAPAQYNLLPAPAGDRDRIRSWPHPWKRTVSQLLPPSGGCPLPTAPLMRQLTGGGADEEDPLVEPQPGLPIPAMLRQVSNPYF